MPEEIVLRKNDKFTLGAGITKEDIDNLDTEKLSNELLKALYAVNSALFVNAGNEVNRLTRFKSALDHIENQLTDREYLDSLNEKDRINLYKVLQSNSIQSSDYLLKLSTSMAAGLDSISKIKAAKTNMEQRASSVDIPESREERKELLKNVRAELERRKESGENET